MALDRRDLAMQCGPAGRMANKANLLGAAGRFLLDREDADAIFTRVADTVCVSWHVTMRRLDVSEQDCEAIWGVFVYDGLFYEMGVKDA